MTSPSSPNPHPAKRQRQSSADASAASPTSPTTTHPGASAGGLTNEHSPTAESLADGPSAPNHPGNGGGGGGGGAKVGQSSSFRNVSACNRCRLRKNRCDQKLPSCASCAKASVACVGYDPITKKEIPRSYVFYLETRIEQLEGLLAAHGIEFPPAEDLALCSRGVAGAAAGVGSGVGGDGSPDGGGDAEMSGTGGVGARDGGAAGAAGAAMAGLPGGGSRKTQPGMMGVVSPSKPRSLASASGVSFARVVYAAVQYSVSDQNSNHGGNGSNGSSNRGMAGSGSNGPSAAGTPNGKSASGASASSGGTSMRDSFFGLHTKPTIRPAPFPDKEVADRLVSLYFEHANPQIPILHRPEFMRIFEQAYATSPNGGAAVRGPRELYMLNMVFAIGSGVIVGEPVKKRDNKVVATAGDGESSSSSRMAGVDQQQEAEERERAGQAQPEEYHASAIVHLEACLSHSGGSLEVLQAVLLLANFALLRPVPPGLWYIIGVAVRLAVDLGLHYEDGSGVDPSDNGSVVKLEGSSGDERSRERGRRLWTRDLRRRLWWCTYSFDRLVSVCVGRPFGISDQVITTEFPTLLDDRYITPAGFLEPPLTKSEPPSPDGLSVSTGATEPSYKTVAHHYFRLRLLQSEILQVLQHNLAQAARARGQNAANTAMHTRLPSPFLSGFDSFRSWRVDIDRRLYEWRTTAPVRAATGVQFATDFFELNYWQAIIVLYRQSLSVPALFEGEYDTSHEVDSPAVYGAELLRGDEDRVYLKVAEAGQRILRIYRQLHLSGLVSYIYLTTHHLFMAGIAYLYAIWHSPIVRSRLTMDEVDFTILAAKSVFSDLIDKCPPAEACRDAFDRTAKATIKMANSTGGFGVQVQMQQMQAPQGPPPSLVATTSQPRRSNTRDSGQMDWADVAASSLPSLRRRPPQVRAAPPPPPQQPQQQQQHVPQLSTGGPFGFDVGDALSSPALSNAGDLSSIGSPPARIKGFDGAGSFGGPVVGGGGSRSAPSPSEMGLSAVGSDLLPSPTVGRRTVGPPPASSMGAGAMLGGDYPGVVDFQDLQSLEFLQSLQGAPGVNGVAGGTDDFTAGLDQAQLDLGFGMGWDGGHHDFSDGGQQINMFEGFFFGGQQGGMSGGGGGGGMGPMGL